MESNKKPSLGTPANPDADRAKWVKIGFIALVGLFIGALILRSVSKPDPEPSLTKSLLGKNTKEETERQAPPEAFRFASQPKHSNSGNQRQSLEGSLAPTESENPSPKMTDPNEVNNIVAKMKKAFTSHHEEPRDPIDPYPYKYDVGGGKVEASYLSPYWRRRLSPEFQQIRAYNGASMRVEDQTAAAPTSREKREIKAAATRSDIGGYGLSLPPGTVLYAVTLDRIHSDFPTTVRARVTSPPEAAGAILLLKTASQNANRISVTPDQLVMEDRAVKITGVVRAGLPGVTGRINRHVARKALNPLAAAGLIAYGTVFGSRNNNTINTEDAIRASLIQEGLNIGVGELRKYTGDIPNTVDAKAGTRLEILLTETLTLE